MGLKTLFLLIIDDKKYILLIKNIYDSHNKII